MTKTFFCDKDIFVTKGWASTAGSKMLQGYQSPFDAEVVGRLKQAGSVNIGKLNCDEFAMGSSNENSAYGNVANPWDARAVPGGLLSGKGTERKRIAPLAEVVDLRLREKLSHVLSSCPICPSTSMPPAAWWPGTAPPACRPAPGSSAGRGPGSCRWRQA